MIRVLGAAIGRVRVVLLPLAAIPAGGACADPGDGTSGPPGPLQVVATTGMVADLVREIGGGRVAVAGLMGPGVDPHLFKASAGDVRALAAADAVFYSGLHLEAAMGEVLEEMSERTPTFAVAEEIPPERRIASSQFSGSWDPHVWFDVGLWSLAADRVARALAELDPDGAEAYRANHAALRDTLGALDAWVRAEVSRLAPERRVLVTAHDAFGYFGRAYGFEVVGLQGISTASEASTADVQRLAALIVARRLPSIFVETSVSPRTIEAVRAAVRARGFAVEIGGSLYSDAMGDPGTPEGRYPGMVRHNVRTIVDALARAPEAPR
jgi:manganese/zinc/iron transport system substrate-binding protein